MIVALKGQEFVDGRYRRRVGAPQPELAAAWQSVGRVADVRLAGCHARRTGDLAVVDEAGQREVALSKGGGDGLHVGPDLSHTRRVGGIPLKSDKAAVRQGLEAMEGGVLIHTHGGVAALLDPREGAI